MMMSNNFLKDIAVIGAGVFGGEVNWHIDHFNEKIHNKNLVDFSKNVIN